MAQTTIIGELDEPGVQPRQKSDPSQKSAGADPAATFTEQIFPLRYFREQAEIKAIQSALKLTGWNRKRASRLLKISYRGLLYKIRRHDIHPT